MRTCVGRRWRGLNSVRRPCGGGAELIAADLRRVDLRLADLFGANLSGADLSEANLNGADLNYANLHGTGLDEVNHTQPPGLASKHEGASGGSCRVPGWWVWVARSESICCDGWSASSQPARGRSFWHHGCTELGQPFQPDGRRQVLRLCAPTPLARGRALPRL